MIACLVVPPQVRFVPLYMLFSTVGLLNTYASLILPYAVSALGTFLIREAFMQVSDDIVDAARVDGAGVLTHHLPHHGPDRPARPSSPSRCSARCTTGTTSSGRS